MFLLVWKLSILLDFEDRIFDQVFLNRICKIRIIKGFLILTKILFKWNRTLSYQINIFVRSFIWDLAEASFVFCFEDLLQTRFVSNARRSKQFVFGKIKNIGFYLCYQIWVNIWRLFWHPELFCYQKQVGKWKCQKEESFQN